MGKLDGKRIAFLAANEGVEQVGLTDPWKAVEKEGATPELISLEAGEVQAFNHLDKADTFGVDRTVSDADASDYEALVLPGGVANPDNLRMDEHAVPFVRGFFEPAKPVGVICHAPWTLVEAECRDDRTITSIPCCGPTSNAGGTWVDEEVVVDEGLVSSRNPDDLPAFCAKLVEEFSEGRHEAQRAASAPRPALDDGGRRATAPAAILDIDGTLVDTNYHHALAWYRGVPGRRLRPAAVADPPPHRDGRRPARGGADRRGGRPASTATASAKREKDLYMEPDRRGLSARRRRRAAGRASSARAHCRDPRLDQAKPDEVEHYVDLLDARELVDGWTTSGDVEQTKPEPDLVRGRARQRRRGATTP